MSLNICSLNVRGIQDMQKRRKLFLWLRNKKCDIYFIQETHSTNKNEKLWKNEWGGNLYLTYASSNSTGCGLMFGRGLSFDLIKIQRDINGRFLIVQIKIDTEIFTLVNIYGPNRDNPDFFSNIFETLDNFETDNIILGGDFNFIQDLNIDKYGGLRNTFIHSRERVRLFCEENQLVDIWRVRNPTEKKFTWQRSNPEIFCRLDYFFIPLHMSLYVTDSKILPAISTDHSLITVKFQKPDSCRGPGYWKLNTSLLTDIEYVHLIKQVIKTSILEQTEDEIDYSVLWELIKFNIKTETIKYSKQKKKVETEIINYHETRIKNLTEAVLNYSCPEEKDTF